MKRILFVCMGNICRSPTAEGVFRHFVKNKMVDANVEIDSAGTIGFHAGKSADPRMQDAASQKGYQLTSISRRVQPEDLQSFDLVIAMDRENLADLRALEANHLPDEDCQIKLLSEFLGDEWPTDVPDPYYGGEDGFRYVVEMIESACPALVDYMELKPH